MTYRHPIYDRALGWINSAGAPVAREHAIRMVADLWGKDSSAVKRDAARALTLPGVGAAATLHMGGDLLPATVVEATARRVVIQLDRWYPGSKGAYLYEANPCGKRHLVRFALDGAWRTGRARYRVTFGERKRATHG